MAFGELIKRERTRNGWLGRELAARLEVDSATVTRLEKGSFKDTPSPELMKRIYDVLGISQITLLESLGYEVRPISTDGSETIDPVVAELIRKITTVRLTDERADGLERLLDLWRDLDTKAQQRIEQDARANR